MTVKELIQKLQGLPQDATVVVPGDDHSYYRLWGASSAKAAKEGGDMYEYYEDCYDEGEQPTVIDVVVIR